MGPQATGTLGHDLPPPPGMEYLEAVRDGDPIAPGPGEQSIALTRDFRLLQKRRGHRYSVDDMLVAHLVTSRCRSVERALDLGCGLGSVLLITAWAFPTARLVGLEILPEHIAFARRNILLNGCSHRAGVVAGDLRDPALVDSLGRFDLVTGSPPYFDPRAGTVCADPSRAAAHFEMSGGIEAYAAAASRVLVEGGVFVTCAGADPPGRATAALAQAGLAVGHRQAVVPRAGKPPFLILLVAHKGATACVDAPPLVLRDADGRRTAQHRAIRASTGVSRRDRVETP